MTHYVTVTLGGDAYITLKTTQYGSTEEAMAAIVENKRKFLYELFGGTKRVEDSDALEDLEITGIF